MPDEPTPTDPTPAPASSPDGGTEATGSQADDRVPSWAVRIGRGLAIAVAFLAFLALGVLLVLQTEIGRSKVQTMAVSQIQNLLADGAEVEVERLGGNFLTGARLTGLVIRQDGEVVASVDTVLIDYNLLTLLKSRFSASRVYVAGPTVFLRQRADSTFNINDLLKPTEPTTDSTGSNFVVQVDSLGLLRGRAEVRFYNPDRDSVLVIDGVALRASGLYAGPDSLTARINGFETAVTAPDGAAQLDLVASGAFSREALDLDVLRITSAAGTDISGEVRYTLGEMRAGLPVVDADLAINPLALEDVRALTALDLFGDPRMRLTARSSNDGLNFALQGAVSGGTVTLDGTLQNDGAGARRLRYRVEGQVNGVDPSVVTRNPALAATLNGTVDVDLAGTSPRTINGPFAITLTDSRVGDRAIDRFRVDGEFQTGRIEFDLAAGLPGLDLDAEGSARPFDPTPTYDFRGQAYDVNLARVLRDPSQTTQFSGTFVLSGAGFRPETALAEAQVALDNVRSGDLAFDYLDATANLRGGQVRFLAETQVANGGGLIEASGTAQPFGQPIRYTVESGHVTRLDLSKLTGNPDQTSDLTGTFTLQGSGIDPNALDLDLTASLRDSRYGDYDLVAIDASADVQGGLLSFDADADLGRIGRINAEGTARPFDDVITYSAQGRVDNLDLAELTGDPANQSDLSTAFRAEGRGIDPQTMSLTARLDLDPSSYGAQEVTGGALDLRLENGGLTLLGDLSTPEGQFALDVTGRPFDETPSFAFGERMCFTSLDLATLTGNPDLRSRLTGCFRGTISGFDLATASGQGTLTLQPSTFKDAQIERGAVAFTLGEGTLDATADLAFTDDETGFPDGTATFAIKGRLFDETPTYAANGALDALDVAAVLGLSDEQPARLTLQFDVEGAGFDPETMTVRGLLAGGHSKVGGAAIDTLRADFNLDRGVLDLDTLFVASDLADAQGGGRLVLTDRPDAGESQFTFDAVIDDLAPLNAYVAEPLTLEEARINALITSDPGRPLMFDIATVAKQFAYGTTAVNGLDSRMTGSFNAAALALDLRTRVEFDFFSRPGLLIEEGDFDILYNPEQFSVEGAIRVDRRRAFDFFARLDLNPNEPVVMLERMRLRLDNQPWALAGPTRISYGDAYRIQNLLLRSADGEQQIAADGVIDPNGDQAFVLTIENFVMDGLTDLAGYDGLGGRLTTTLLMTGPAEDPEIAGTLTLSEFTSRGRPVGAIDVDVDYADSRLGLGARLDHISGSALTADGFLPLNFSLADAAAEGIQAVSEASDADAVRFVVRADSFPVNWVKPFLDPNVFTTVDGVLTIPDSLTLSGTQAEPRLDGDALLSGGRIGLVAVGRIYETITVPLRLIGNEARIENATITDPNSGQTHLTLNGSVRLPKLSLGELDFTVTPNQFLATETNTYDGLVLNRGRSPIRLTGTIDRPTLRGSAALARGDIYLTDELVAPEFEEVTLTDEDLRMLEARFGRRITARDTSVSRFFQALDLDLNVEIERDVWIRAKSGLPFDIEFSGNIRAVKAPYAESTNLYGTVELNRGSVETFNRRFEIESGTLTFNGPIEETLVNLSATLDIRTDPTVGTTAVQINLLAQGRLGEDMTVTLSSTPQLDNADIVSLIATGRLAEDFIGGGALAGAAQGLAVSQLSGLVEGVAGNALGLDVIQIDQGPNGLVVRLGKYLTSKAFLSVGQPLNVQGEGGQGLGTQVTLEYTLLRWLLAQIEYQADDGTGSSVGAGFIYEYAY